MKRLWRDPDWLIALGLFVFALGLRAFMLVAYPFDGLYGQDAYAYYDYAGQMRDSLIRGQSLPAFFWPLGYPLHIVAAMAIVGAQSLAGQIVSVIAGALISPLTFALAHEALLQIDPHRARRAGVIAGLIVAVAGQLMISSLSVMSDATGLAWATASAWLTLRYARTLRPGTLALAAFTLSIAVITRWVFGLLALPWAICVLLAWRRSWASVGLPRGFMLGVMVVAIGGSIVGTQLLLGESHTGDLQVVGWDLSNAFRSTAINSDGTFKYPMPIGLFYAQPLIHPAFLFPLLAPLWLVGLWSLAPHLHRAARGSAQVQMLARSLLASGLGLGRTDSPTGALLIGWPLVVYGFLAGIAWESARFPLAFFPPLAVWAGLGFDRIWEDRSTWRRGLSALTTIAVVGAFVWSMRVVNNFVLQNKNANLARAQRIVEQLPRGTHVITFGLTMTLRRYTDLDAIEIYTETPATLADRVCGRDAVYLYLDVANIEQQWAGLAPEINTRWLRDGPGLEMIDQFEGYTLFKVGSDC